jgi:hypothetical protein
MKKATVLQAPFRKPVNGINIMTLSKFSRIFLLSLFLTLASELARAQVVINRFDSASETSGWRYDFGGVADRTIEFDPSMDADGNPASGALKFTMVFNAATFGGNNQIAFTRDIFPAINGNELERLQMDVRVDPSSPVGTSGAYGLFQTAIRNTPNYIYNALAEGPLTVADQWIHLEPTLTGPVDAIRGITWKIWGGSGQNLTGTYTLWIDNVVFTQPPPTSPPPTMVMEPLTPGLEIYASLGAQYQRQDIRTSSGDYSWLAPGVGAVTYSFTIAKFPAETNNGFETRILLVGNNPAPGDQADYKEGNVVYYRIYENPTGSGYLAELRYKVNAVQSNIFDGPLVAAFTTPTIVGTWGMTLEGTNAIIFAPDGSNTNGFFGEDVFTAFEQSAAVYIGIIPNDTTNLGQSVLFSGVSVSGANTPLVDNFSNLDNWVATVAQDPDGVVLVVPDAIRKLTWPASAAGFVLQSVAELAEGAAWSQSSLQVRTIRDRKLTILGPDTGNAFFRLEKPAPPPPP